MRELRAELCMECAQITGMRCWKHSGQPQSYPMSSAVWHGNQRPDLFWCAVAQKWRVNECLHYHDDFLPHRPGCGWPRWKVEE